MQSSPEPAFSPAPGDALGRQVRFFETSMAGRFLDSSPSLTLVVNEERLIVFASEEFRRKLHQGSEETLTGRRLGDLLGCVHAATAPSGCGTGEHCRQCGANKAMLSALGRDHVVQEFRNLRLVGGRTEALDLRIKATPLNTPVGRLTVLSAEDIGDEKRRRALESIFFHDILNTAGGLKGLVSLLAERLPPEFDAEMRVISSGLATLVEEIVGQKELLAAEGGQLTPCPVEVSTRHLVRSVCARYARTDLAEGKHIVVADADPDLVLETDSRLLSRVLGNLVKNGLEASTAGDTVTISVRRLEGAVEFSVHNPAVMTEDVALQIFKRSFSTKGAGRGLGTYSVMLLTERYLGGHAKFESLPGEGTTFRVRLPLAQSPSDHATSLE